ncbi:ferritin-like protein [Streptomyces sp. NPDC017254]|uniref:ferritin-like domain-containing protein n=1 Tax=unclassified Streptomyces TaxID=2593676 RepID=UPI0037A04023
MNPLLSDRSNRIVELMDLPAERRDVDWSRDAVQQAILLELATLPPYLCGMWSIDDTGGDGQAFDTLHAIVFDEMSHLGLACNLLTTIGGVPVLADAAVVPAYPGPLPGGVRPELSVFLGGLTKDSLKMYARIEEPDDPIVEAKVTYTSIGAFYSAILDAFRAHPEMITGARQLTRNMAHHGSGNSLVALDSPATVESAVAVIKEQGEGTSASPENPHPAEDGELAHYYAFLELFHGRRLIEMPGCPGTWDFQGAAIPMPGTLPMGVVPLGGWPRTGPSAPDSATAELLDTFNRSYSGMLRFLEQAWRQDDPTTARQLLKSAVREMGTLQDPARDLMRRPLPDGSGKTYGPEFRYVAP